MCGIAGIINPQRTLVDRIAVEAMTRTLHRRGPDDEGYYISDQVGFGHRRLSIIDLDTGHQPIFNEDQSVVVVLNGELYNFLELRQELTTRGHRFHTQTDTEVLVHGYEEWGMELLLQKLEGMFAFALHDKGRGVTFIARDKFGEKPLYYGKLNDQYYFASELKALLTQSFSKEISIEGLNMFLSLSYIPAPYTIYRQIQKLEPGHYLYFDGTNGLQNSVYYRLEEQIKPSTLTFEEAKKELYDRLLTSVKTRMISDVPIGAFLSGGIDSSVIVGLMSQISKSPIHTFSIGFKEKEFDESDRAQLIADTFKTTHTLHYLDYNDVLDILDDLILYFDEPYGDSSAIPSYYVAKMAREKVKVVLTGDCADELFGGYEKYLGSYYAKRYLKWPKGFRYVFEKGIQLIPHNSYTNTSLRKIKKVIRNASSTGFDRGYNYMCMGCSDNERKALLQTEHFCDIKPIVRNSYDRFSSDDELNKTMFSDVQTVLEGDMFPKVDRVCMMNSLENRPPFLDSKLVEFALSLPSSYKVNGRIKKHIIKDTFRSLLPKKTLEYRKSGFSAPIGDWLKSQLKNQLLHLLSVERLSRQGIFAARETQKIMEEHFSSKADHSTILWNLFVFQKWYDKQDFKASDRQ